MQNHICNLVSFLLLHLFDLISFDIDIYDKNLYQRCVEQQLSFFYFR